MISPTRIEPVSSCALIREVGIVYRSSIPPITSLYPYCIKRLGEGFVVFLKGPDERALSWVSLEYGFLRTLSESDCSDLRQAQTIDCDSLGNIFVLSEREQRVSILDAEGRHIRKFGLNLGARPVALHCLPDGLLLVGTWRPGGLFLVDQQGHVRWAFQPGDDVLAEARSAIPDGSGGFYVADAGLHRVAHIAPDGSVRCVFGQTGSPGYGPNRLSNPAMIADDGSGLLICDARNHRVMKIKGDGSLIWEWPACRNSGVQLSIPWSIVPLGADGYLLADTYNFRLLHLSPELVLAAEIGATPVERRVLSFPRSVQQLESDNTTLVADTYNNRIVKLDHNSNVQWQFGGELPGTSAKSLFWPRKAKQLANGIVLIADSRNNRLLWVDEQGSIVKELTRIKSHSDICTFDDPHDFSLTPDNHLVICDSGNNRVVMLDPEDRCVWDTRDATSEALAWELSDPHHAYTTNDNRLLVSDTGNNRIVVYTWDSAGCRLVREMTLNNGGENGGLKDPRACCWRYDAFWILDSGNSRMLIVSEDERVLWRWDGHLVNSPLPNVHLPRWFHILSRQRILVSDYFNGRVVELELPPWWQDTC